MAHRHSSVACAGNTRQHAKIFGRVTDCPERLAQCGTIRAGGKFAARTLGIIQIAFDQYDRRARVARDTHATGRKRCKLLLGRLGDGFFFWLCDVGMRSPIVCVPTII